MNCPCQSGKNFNDCCEAFIEGIKFPQTAEELMRSRYTAYAKGNIAYIKKTLAPESQKDFDENASKAWAARAEWLGLEIMSTKKGQDGDKTGIVEFTAKYREDGEVLEHHETSEFKKNKQGHWVFVDGDSHTHKEGEGHHHHHKQETIRRDEPKIGRNDPCTCGSGKKYKKCCGAVA